MARTKQIARGQIPLLWGLYYYPSDSNAFVSLPLLNVRVAASIKELAAEVKLTQTYGNDGSVPIEAVYAFPVPARASVYSFEMIKQDGSRVVGRIQEKMEARETYKSAISEGKQAALMEQQTPDVFQLAVGNIQPHEQVKIELIYATVLSEDEENDSIRFHLPVQIGCRYGLAPGGQQVYSFWTPDSPFLDISVSVEAIAPIAKIGSPSHAVSTELGPDPALSNVAELPFSNYARVSLSSETALDKDFVLTVKSAGLDAPRCIAELHPIYDTVALALTLVPRFKLPDLARQEYIFLIDRSGSMEGSRITAAKKALVVMLRSLPAKNSFFQIASFGSRCTQLWEDGSRPYNQMTLENATHHVDGMDANFGGTEIRHALAQCIETRRTDRPTAIFLLTDGEAWDLDGVLDEITDAVAKAPTQAYLRISVLGIGDSVSTAMCQGIARVGNGTCMLVGEQETNFTGKIARMLKAARTPMISDIGVDWGVPVIETTVDEDDEFVMVPGDENVNEKVKEKGKGKEKEKVSINIFNEAEDPMQLDSEPVPSPPEVVLPPFPQIQQSPFRIRTLSPGNRLNVYAILQGKIVPKTVTLAGLTEDGSEVKLPIPVTFSNLPNSPESSPAVHALAARTIIQDLEDGQHSITTKDPDDPDLLARTVKASIARLGKAFSISSSETSFVAVEEPPAEESAPDNTPSGRLRQPDVIRVPAQGTPVVVARRSGRGGVTSGGSRGRARVSGGGKAARKQLAPTAAQRTAPSGGLKRKSMAESDYALVAEKLDLAIGGAKRHRRMPVQDLDEESADDFIAEAEADEDDAEEEDEDEDEAESTPTDPLEALARLQSFDGCFSLGVLSVVHLTLDAAQARPALLEDISDNIFATILAMAFLSNKLGPEVERDSWEAMYEKARVFVEDSLRAGGVAIGVGELETKALSILA
ncbi:von Willebrand factor type A domain-containing protein [Mycena metata]|uniref:von Willebrand factor type A domain-containing protein n=1 Tax=Mycena metata TaxID=1033252 RepID=A0AAD7K7Q8_9AGAR|nr:von Willebrand factor type A domain-containing protein [Mycena metata]